MLGISELTADGFGAADINSDGKISILDYIMLKEILLIAWSQERFCKYWILVKSLNGLHMQTGTNTPAQIRVGVLLAQIHLSVICWLKPDIYSKVTYRLYADNGRNADYGFVKMHYSGMHKGKFCVSIHFINHTGKNNNTCNFLIYFNCNLFYSERKKCFYSCLYSESQNKFDFHYSMTKY